MRIYKHKEQNWFDLRDFIPEKIHNTKNTKVYPFGLRESKEHLVLAYITENGNQKRDYSETIHRRVIRNQETFEVLGLLQAEMGKQPDGKIVFCNHEYNIINKVLKWFEKELEFPKNEWKWYIKLNINEPEDETYKNEVENKLINYWIKKTNLSLDQSYPKKVTYITNTPNKKNKFSDYGTLIIEKRHNILSQIIKKFVRDTLNQILDCNSEEIRGFMRGIIAGESCIEINLPSSKYRVHISSTNPKEKEIYHKCLDKLGIKSIIYPEDKLIISKKENHLKLLKQKLVCLSPKKYNKFLRMMGLYENFPEYEEFKKDQIKPHNKIPQDIIDYVTQLHFRNPDYPSWEIAKMADISDIKVQRIRKTVTLK